MRKLGIIVTVSALTILIPAWGQEVGSNQPPDQTLVLQRSHEGGTSGSGIFDVAVPTGKKLKPVQRVPRAKYGVVGPFPLTLKDLDALVYPDLTPQERQALLEGLSLFTAPHTPEEGAGPMANQPFCLGCHQNAADQVPHAGVLSTDVCVPGSTCVSLVTRAARSTPTNFKVTSLDPATGGGVAPGRVIDGKPDPNANVDAINGPGRTAAFTIFNDFAPNHPDTFGNPGFQDPLDGGATNIVTNMKSQPFGGIVQHVRPSLDVCVPKPIPPVEADANLMGTQDPMTHLWPSGFFRSVGERAGPPYIGRGLIEAVPTADIVANADPDDTSGHHSRLKNFAPSLGCTGDCIAGRTNMIPRSLTVHTDPNDPNKITTVTGFVGGVGRFGLRANGVEIIQFTIGGLQGELGFTTLINNSEINFPTLFPANQPPTTEPAECLAAAHTTPEVHLSSPFSERNLIRNMAPPEFGSVLLRLLKSSNPASPRRRYSEAGKVQRGAQLFGIDLVAFANRMIAGKMPAHGDGRDLHAINQKDRELNCVGCHTPVQRTGQSPTTITGDPGADELSYRWAPIFSDLLIHKMPVIDAERFSPRPRDTFLIDRAYTRQDKDDERGAPEGNVFSAYDLTRSFADDIFSTAKGSSLGSEFRTAPLMGMGRIGPPFMHDARIFLSKLTVDKNPASTVGSSRKFTNAPLVIENIEDAIRAAIEMHDLPAPDDHKTPNVPGAGCPVPPSDTNINYGASPQDVICPAYGSDVSKTHRSDAREVIRRFRNLDPEDQEALIEFLKQL